MIKIIGTPPSPFPCLFGCHLCSRGRGCKVPQWTGGRDEGHLHRDLTGDDGLLQVLLLFPQYTGSISNTQYSYDVVPVIIPLVVDCQCINPAVCCCCALFVFYTRYSSCASTAAECVRLQISKSLDPNTESMRKLQLYTLTLCGKLLPCIHTANVP